MVSTGRGDGLQTRGKLYFLNKVACLCGRVCCFCGVAPAPLRLSSPSPVSFVSQLRNVSLNDPFPVVFSHTQCSSRWSRRRVPNSSRTNVEMETASQEENELEKQSWKKKPCCIVAVLISHTKAGYLVGIVVSQLRYIHWEGHRGVGDVIAVGCWDMNNAHSLTFSQQFEFFVLKQTMLNPFSNR